MRICVFCGAAPRVSKDNLDLARQVGGLLAASGATLVFGGGGLGMMGAVASGAVEAGGAVTGILPRFLFDREPPHPQVHDIRVVDTMHERKALMYELSDAFLTLPGGFGTLDETMEVMTWRQLSIHAKPVIFVSASHFWRGVEQTFDQMHADGFLSDADRALAAFATEPEQALALLTSMVSAAAA